MKESDWTGCYIAFDLKLEPNQMVLVHCTAHNGNVHAYQVSSHSDFK